MAIDVFAADEQKDEPVDTMRWVRLASDVLGAVPADLTLRSRRFRKQPAPLIIAHRLHSHAGRFCKPSDGVRTFRLIPYHGTDAIWGETGAINTPAR